MTDDQLSVGKKFNSFTSFQCAIKKHETESQAVFICKNSRKVLNPELKDTLVYERLMFECKHGTLRKSMGSGKRPNQRSVKLGCKARIIAHLRRGMDGRYYLQITTADLRHNAHTLRPTISTKEFIAMVKERVPLWQRSHQMFSDRKTRRRLFQDIADAAGITVNECAKKLRVLKETLRLSLLKLPRTKSGIPDLSMSHLITWQYFKPLIFMVDEVKWTKSALSMTAITRSGECEGGRTLPGSDAYYNSDFREDVKPDLSDSMLHLVSIASVESLSSELTITSDSMQQGSLPDLNEAQQLFVPDGKENACGRVEHQQSDMKDRDFALLEPMVPKDEFEVFALDIVNDLRKLQNPISVMKAKSAIRRVVEGALLSELEALGHSQSH